MIKILHDKEMREKGYTLLFAVLVSALVLAVGVSILNLSRKELILTAGARESEYAFYAADSGYECATYYDYQGVAGGDGTTLFSTTTFLSGQVNVTCGTDAGNSSVSSAVTKSLVDAGTNSYKFNFTMPISGTACADVEVDKTYDPYGGATTTISSMGYNMGWHSAGQNNTGDCSGQNSNTEKVNRELVTSYSSSGALPPPPTTYYSITTAVYTDGSLSNSGGSISPSNASVSSGGSQTFIITKNSGYTLASVSSYIVDGVSIDNPYITSYIFNNVTGTHTITVNFTSTTAPPPLPPDICAYDALYPDSSFYHYYTTWGSVIPNSGTVNSSGEDGGPLCVNVPINDPYNFTVQASSTYRIYDVRDSRTDDFNGYTELGGSPYNTDADANNPIFTKSYVIYPVLGNYEIDVTFATTTQVAPSPSPSPSPTDTDSPSPSDSGSGMIPSHQTSLLANVLYSVGDFLDNVFSKFFGGK